jgi:phospholipid/cholesterol/gamma-HCH transport system permease protein
MDSLAQHSVVDDGADSARLVLSGQLTLSTIGPLAEALKHIETPIRVVDIAGVEEIDTVGA